MKNRKTMNLQKRVTAFFLTMLMFFSCFGEGISTVVEAAEVSSTEHHIYGYGYDFSNSGLRKAYDPTTQKMMILLINISGVLVTGTTSRMSVEKYAIALNWA